MEKISFGFDIGTTDATADLGLRVRLDNVVVYENTHVTNNIVFAHELPDDVGEHVLEIELFGKKPEHTVVNEAGEIIKDAMLTVRNITMDDIDISSIISDSSVYKHSFNGTSDPIDDQFFSDLGCNGTVRMPFTTPAYLWLLENIQR